MSDLGDLNLGFTSNKPTQYLLDYGDFMCTLIMLFNIREQRDGSKDDTESRVRRARQNF